eukprot:GSA25T00012243001.1
MAAIETKMPGYFTRNKRADYLRGISVKNVTVNNRDRRGRGPVDESWTENQFTPILCEADWAIDTMWIRQDELSFALGTNGVTRKKIMKASNCILEFVGNIAHLGGNKRERRICRDYLVWLLAQKVGVVGLEDLDRAVYSASEYYEDTQRRERRKRRKKQDLRAARKHSSRYRSRGGRGSPERSKAAALKDEDESDGHGKRKERQPGSDADSNKESHKVGDVHGKRDQGGRSDEAGHVKKPQRRGSDESSLEREDSGEDSGGEHSTQRRRDRRRHDFSPAYRGSPRRRQHDSDEDELESDGGRKKKVENSPEDDDEVNAEKLQKKSSKSSKGEMGDKDGRTRKKKEQKQIPNKAHSDSEISDADYVSEDSANGTRFRSLANRPAPARVTKARKRDARRFTHNISREEYQEFVYGWARDRDDIDICYFYERCDLFSPTVLRQIEEKTGTYTFVDHLSNPSCLFVCGAFRSNRQIALDAVYAVLQEHECLTKTSWSDEYPEAGSGCRIKAPLNPNKRHLSTAEKDLIIAAGAANVEVGAGAMELSETFQRFEQKNLAFYTMLASSRNRTGQGAQFFNEMREEELLASKREHRQVLNQDDAEDSDGGRFDSVELWRSPLADNLQIYQQPGPLGEDPLLESLESIARLRVSMLVGKNSVRLEGEPKALRDAWRKLNAFAAKFESMVVEVRQTSADTEHFLRSLVAHYIGPLPWLSKAEVRSATSTSAAVEKDDAGGENNSSGSKPNSSLALEMIGHSVSLQQGVKILEEYVGEQGNAFVYRTRAVANPNAATVGTTNASSNKFDAAAGGGHHASSRSGGAEGVSRRDQRRAEREDALNSHLSLSPTAVVGVRDYRNENSLEALNTEWVSLTREEIPFVLGSSGSTRDKLSRAAKALIHGQTLTLEKRVALEGSAVARHFLKKYLELVRKQRTGPVSVKDPP